MEMAYTGKDDARASAVPLALLDVGVAVFDELRQTVKNIEFLANPEAGEIRVGCNQLLAASFASAVVDRLSRRYPRIMFHLVTGYVEALHHELSERNVDLLVARRFGLIADERLGFEFLFDDSCVVATGAQSSNAATRSSPRPHAFGGGADARRVRAWRG